MKHDIFYTWIDSLRVSATLAVIFVHVNGDILYQYGSISNLDWWTGNVYGSCLRFCVPIFLMISGALILPKSYKSLGEYLKKRVLRILFPFLFWSIIYVARLIFIKLNQGEYMTFTENLKFICDKLFMSSASVHLWYIYLIIGLYLFFPIIGKWINNSSKREIEYFIGIWFITLFLPIPLVKDFIPHIELSYFSGYIGFPILGYYLTKFNFEFNQKKLIYILLILTGFLITLFGTYFDSERRGHFELMAFYNYRSPNVALLSIGIFLLFKDFVQCSAKTSSVILFFSKYSYGTYLIHVLVLVILSKVGFTYSFIHPIIGMPVTSVLCLIISTIMIWGVNKLPFGKYISG